MPTRKVPTKGMVVPISVDFRNIAIGPSAARIRMYLV